MTIQSQSQTRTAWDAIAAGFDEFVTEPGMPSAEDALRRAGLQPGMRLLDVACGPGTLGIPAARLGAQVTAVDLSPKMAARLEARARKERLSNIAVRVMDGHALELEDNTFDMAASQFGVMLFPDLPRALRELVRVVKPGGRVVLVVYAPPETLDFMTFALRALHTAVPDFPDDPMDPPPPEFQVSDPEKLRRALADAGLKDIRVEAGAERLELNAGKELWDWVVNSNPLAVELVADLSQAQRLAVQQAMDDLLRERSEGRPPAILTNPVHIGIGTK